jgi:hypothetical protein
MNSSSLAILICILASSFLKLHSFRNKLRLPPSKISFRRAAIPVDDLYVFLYDVQLSAASAMETQLSAPSPLTAGLLYSTGLLSSFSPCEISLLPLTLAYLGGDSASEGMPPRLLFSSIFTSPTYCIFMQRQQVSERQKRQHIQQEWL